MTGRARHCQTKKNGNHRRHQVFSGTAHRGLADEICRELSCDLGKATTARFSDGEFNFQIKTPRHGLLIVQPTCPPTDAYLMELLVMLDAFRDHRRADTAVLPYYGRAEKDRPRVPISAKLVEFADHGRADRI